MRCKNSFISNKPFYEYQMDLFFINDSDEQEYSTGLLMIDIFTKFMTVTPIKSKQSDDVLEGITQALHNMGRNPEVIYSDDEGSFKSAHAEQFYKDHNIKHIVTRLHSNYAERAIRTIKNMIFKRLEQHDELRWYDNEILSNALVTYNYKMENSTTHMTPNEAREPKNKLEVAIRLEAHRIKTRNYPDVNIGDLVRIYTKKKNSQKENISVWSPYKYKVVKIDESQGQKFYHIDGQTRPLLRHEILKA